MVKGVKGKWNRRKEKSLLCCLHQEICSHLFYLEGFWIVILWKTPYLGWCESLLSGIFLWTVETRSLVCSGCLELYCYNTVLYCTVLYCTVLYNCTILYCTVQLYCTVMYCTLHLTGHRYLSVQHTSLLFIAILYITLFNHSLVFITILYSTLF